MQSIGMERKRTELELRTREINQALRRRNIGATVDAGAVAADGYRFRLKNLSVEDQMRLQEVVVELRHELGDHDLQLHGTGSPWHFVFGHGPSPAIDLLNLVRILPPIGGVNATLGLDAGANPILLDFADHMLGHVQILGRPGLGKSSLLWSVATSLALNHEQRSVQLAMASLEAVREPLVAHEALNHFPHLVAPVARNMEECHRLLWQLSAIVQRRVGQHNTKPVLVTIIDGLDRLLPGIASTRTRLAASRIIQDGPEVGLHIIGASNDTPAGFLGRILDRRTALRISAAKDQPRPGHFSAATSVLDIDFQAAFAAGGTIAHVARMINQRSKKVLLARPAPPMPRLLAPALAWPAFDDGPVYFRLEEGQVRFAVNAFAGDQSDCCPDDDK